MTKLAKVAAVLIGIMVISSVALYAYLTPERLRTLIVPELELALKRKVSLDSVSLRVWGGVGAAMAGFRVDSREGCGSAPFIQAESSQISISLPSLILGDPDVGELVIQKPSIRVVINQEGNANYADLLEGDDTEASDSGSGTTVVPITRMRILGGSLVQEDKQTGSVTRLEGIDYLVDLSLRQAGIGLDGSLTVKSLGSTDQTGVESSWTNVSIDHRLTLNSAADALVIDKLTINAGPVAVMISGTVSNLSQSAPWLDLKIVETETALAYSDDTVEASGESDIDVSIKGVYDLISVPPQFPDLQGSIVFSNLAIRTPDLLQPITNGKLSISLQANRIVLNEFSGTIGASDLRLDATLERIEGLILERSTSRPLLKFSFTSDQVNLDQMLPPVDENPTSSAESTWALTTPLYAAEAVPDMTSALIPLLRMIDVRGNASIKKLVSGGVLTDVAARVNATNGRLEATEITARMYGGTFGGSVEADLSGSEGPYPTKMDFALQGGQADGVMQNFFNLPIPITGSMGLKMAGSGDLDSTLTFLTNTLDLDGLGDVTDGEIANWAWLKDAAGGIAQLSFIDFDHIPIKDVITKFQVKNGKLITRDLSMTAAEILCKLNGSTDLESGALSYTLDLDLPADRLSVGGVNVGKALGSFFGQSDETSRVIPLQINISGTTAQPKLGVSIKQTGKQSTKGTGKSLLNRFRGR
jgi:uncharacterized protein involved in outer membrane biogenesis